MFGIGMQELILILVVALVVIGPKRLPDIARALGRAMREFRNATDDLKQNLNLEPIDLEPRPFNKPGKKSAPGPYPKNGTEADDEPNAENKASPKPEPGTAAAPGDDETDDRNRNA